MTFFFFFGSVIKARKVNLIVYKLGQRHAEMMPPSVGEVLALQAWELKSGFPAPMQKIGAAAWVWSPVLGCRDRWIL